MAMVAGWAAEVAVWVLTVNAQKQKKEPEPIRYLQSWTATLGLEQL